jgi:hypothetical protein
MMVRSAENLAEQLRVMRWQEITSYKTCDYIHLYSHSPNASAASDIGDALHPATLVEQTPTWQGDVSSVPMRLPKVSPQWREVICEWAYRCKFKTFQAVTIDDRHLSLFSLVVLISCNPLRPLSSGRPF